MGTTTGETGGGSTKPKPKPKPQPANPTILVAPAPPKPTYTPPAPVSSTPTYVAPTVTSPVTPTTTEPTNPFEEVYETPDLGDTALEAPELKIKTQTFRSKKKQSITETLAQIRNNLGDQDIFNQLMSDQADAAMDKEEDAVQRTLDRKRQRIEKVYARGEAAAFDGNLDFIKDFKKDHPGVLKPPSFKKTYPELGNNDLLRGLNSELASGADPEATLLKYNGDGYGVQGLLGHSENLRKKFAFARSRIKDFRESYNTQLLESREFQEDQDGSTGGSDEEGVGFSAGASFLSALGLDRESVQESQNKQGTRLRNAAVEAKEKKSDVMNPLLAPLYDKVKGDKPTNSDYVWDMLVNKSPSELLDNDEARVFNQNLVRGVRRTERFGNVDGVKKQPLPSISDLISLKIAEGEIDGSDESLRKWTKKLSSPFSPEWRNEIVRWKTLTGEYNPEKDRDSQEALAFINAPIKRYIKKKNKSNKRAVEMLNAPLQDPETAEDDGSGTGFDVAAKLIPVVGTYLDQATPVIADKFDKKDVTGGDALYWTIDKLSRPSYAAASFMKEWGRQDNEPESYEDSLLGWGRQAFGGGLLGAVTGKNPTDSIDDLDGGSVGDLAGATWSGFSNGGLGNAESPETFSDVIKYNADRDGVDNLFDNTTYQGLAGLTGDLVFDPLNFIGAGPAKFAVRGIKDTVESLSGISDVNKFVNDAVDYADVMMPRRYASQADQVQHIQSINSAHSVAGKKLSSMPDDAFDDMPGYAQSEARINSITAGLEKQTMDMLNEYRGSDYNDNLMDSLKTAVDEGVLSPAAVDEFTYRVASSRLAGKMDEVGKAISVRKNVAKERGFSDDYYRDPEIRSLRQSEAGGQLSTAQQARLDERLSKTDPDASYGSLSKLAKDRERFEGDELRAYDDELNAAYVEGGKSYGNPRQNFSEILEEVAPGFAKSRGFDARDIDEAFVQSSARVSDELRSLKSKRKSLLNTVRSTEPNTQAHADAKRMLEVTNSDIRNVEAASVLRHLDALSTARSGQKVYKNQAQAKGIQRLIDEIDAELSHPDQSYTGLEGDAEDMSWLDGMVDEQGNYDPALLEPMGGEFSRHSQLNKMKQRLQRESNNLNITAVDKDGRTVLTGSPDNQAVQELGMSTPDIFTRSDGALDTVKVAERFEWKYDPKQSKTPDQMIRVKLLPVDQVDANRWLLSVRDALVSEYREIYSRRYNTAASKSRREYGNNVERKAAETKLSPEDARKFRSMFHSTEYTKDVIKVGHLKIRYPDGTETFVGSVKSRETAAKAATKADREKQYQLQKDLEEVRNWIEANPDSYRKPGTVTLSPEVREPMQRLRQEFELAGLPVPSNIDNFAWFVKANSGVVESSSDIRASGGALRNLDAAVENGRVTERRVFQQTTGYSIKSAREWQKKVLSGTGAYPAVKGGTKEWGNLHPYGVSRRDFISEATEDPDGFRDAVLGGPFNLSFFGRMEKFSHNGHEIVDPRSANMTKYLREHELPEDEIDDLLSAWADAQYTKMISMKPNSAVNQISKSYDDTLRRSRGALNEERKNFLSTQEPTLTGKQKSDIAEESFDYALDNVERQLNRGNLNINKPSNYEVTYDRDPFTTLDDALRYVYGKEKAEAKKAQLAARKAGDSEEFKRLEYRMDQIERRRIKLRKQNAEFKKQARERTLVMNNRIREEAIFKAIANASTGFDRKALAIKIGPKAFELPGSEIMFKAPEIIGDFPVVRKFMDSYHASLAGEDGKGAKSAAQLLPNFKSPSSTFANHEFALQQARSYARSAEVIKLHLDRLQTAMRTIDIDARKRQMRSWVKNYDLVEEGYDAGQFAPLMDEFLDIFNRKNPIYKDKGRFLTIAEINRYLPKEYLMDGKLLGRTLKSGDMKPDTWMHAIRVSRRKNGIKGDVNAIDPYELAWTYRIAIEQAMSRNAMFNAIKDTFGVARVGKLSDRGGFRLIENGGPTEKLKGLGWETIDELNNTHYFPPEAAGDVKRLLQMMEPRQITSVGRHVDDVLKAWKATVTIYNPAYYARNAVGEIMSSWLGGVNTVAPYRDAFKVMAFSRGDGRALDALLKQTPLLKREIGNETVSGSRKLFRSQGKLDWSVEDVWVGYNDAGLKTGFINTEFVDDAQTIAGRFKKDPGKRSTLGKVHDKVRDAGEGQEDGLRMAHFIDVLRKSKAKTKDKAMEEAALAVRKYHFDYQDFSKFEKTVMMRAFPFYKWTRKALPLMATMLFMKPGKVMAYPKVMNTWSGLSTGDLHEDDNGFLPNYSGIAPDWVSDLWAYQISDIQGEPGYANYFNLSTPQFDVYKALNNPAGQAYALSNPFARIPAEQVAGRTFGDQVGGFSVDFDTYPDGNPRSSEDEKWERISHALRLTPQGNLLQKYIKKEQGSEAQAETFNTSLASFFSGMGIYRATGAYDQANNAAVGSGDLNNSSVGHTPDYIESLIPAMMDKSGTPKRDLTQMLNELRRKVDNGA